MAARKKTPEFEAGLKQLAAIVTALESGSLGLDEALRAFEQGVGIARQCQQTLRAAEQRVQRVLEAEGGTVATEVFIDPGREADAE